MKTEVNRTRGSFQYDSKMDPRVGGGEKKDLTERELHILTLSSLRKTDRQIAYVLDASPRAIQSARRAFMARWGVQNDLELFQKATERGYRLPLADK